MSRHHSIAEIKRALEACHGAVYLASEQLGVWPSALYKRINRSQELQALRDRYDGRRTDVAELKLEQAINAGEPWAVKFQLKTKGRTRGYAERVEVESSGEVTVNVEARVSPDLDRAIERTLDVLGTRGQESAPRPGDRLPEGFRAPD